MMTRFMNRVERITLYFSLLTLMAGIAVALLNSPQPKLYRAIEQPAPAFAQREVSPLYDRIIDLNNDGHVDIKDLWLTIEPAL